MRGAVIFREDFNGQHLNLNNWVIDVTATGGWHNEFQVYTNDLRNVYLKNGYLYLKPTLTIDSGHFTDYDLWHGTMDVKKTWGTCTNNGSNGCYRDSKNGLLPPTCSGKVQSKPTLKYGTVTIRAQIPRGDWLLPAMWLMPQKSVYGGWPKSGEIDMMEATCNEFMEYANGQKVGVQRVTGSFHMGPAYSADHHVTGAQYKKQGDWHGFHTYKLEWTPDHLILYVDDLIITRIDIPNGSNVWKHFNFHGNNPWTHGSKIAPFDQEFYLILYNSVGGATGIFGDSTKYAYPKPWKNNATNPQADFWNGKNHWLPTWHGDDVAMLIDYVEFRHL
ncbi:hypothetical protein LOTGIDRAFT_122387 [Lottia gigantea]|uniref:GH16 domain-containing protein n=1 Tax=Lottia gigantea TaxID=225164 RepID=V4A2X2_LOTGI|nr:hypothetical protein LOTGIDRAFT_122387 [Lottia gigantea]ESO91047.1 hypothetical protein LOTGIDRAFT_122387 [Lottia gigantea]